MKTLNYLDSKHKDISFKLFVMDATADARGTSEDSKIEDVKECVNSNGVVYLAVKYASQFFTFITDGETLKSFKDEEKYNKCVAFIEKTNA